MHRTPRSRWLVMLDAMGAGWLMCNVGLTVIMNPSELIRAACEGNATLATAALKRGANVNARYRGRPVLIWAIQEGHLKVVDLLVAAGASLRRRDDSGFSPLDQAVGEGNVEIVRFLTPAHGDAQKSPSSSWTMEPTRLWLMTRGIRQRHSREWERQPRRIHG